MRKFRTLDEFEEEYFRKHPEEIDDYLTEIFQEYSQDNDSGASLLLCRKLVTLLGTECGLQIIFAIVSLIFRRQQRFPPITMIEIPFNS